MVKKAVSLILLTLLLTSMLTMTFNVELVAGSRSKTKIYVDPVVSVANPGEYFTININIANVANLYAWGLWLKWDVPVILLCISVKEGEFLKRGGYSTFFLPPEIDKLKGEMYISCTRLGAVPGETGSGTLATVTFEVYKPGKSNLNLCDTGLVVINPTPPPPLILAPHTVEDGFFYTTVPRPEFTYWPWYPIVNGTVFFDASASYDPDGGAIVNYEWDFGDGTTEKTSRAYISHSYEKAGDYGDYDVRLTVTDNEGETYTFHIWDVLHLGGRWLQVWSIIKVPEDYSTIQEAIDKARDDYDVILVASGTYHEHLVVKKCLVLLGENPETTIIDGDGTGTVITLSETIHCIISGFTVQNGDVGIFLSGAWRCVIRDNTISNNQYGIFLKYSLGIIFSNTISDNLFGVYAYHSYSGLFANNLINNINQLQFVGLWWWVHSQRNYWSDYEGEDLDGDGIGDTNIPHFGDESPLMSPWAWSLVPATVEIDPNTLNLRNRAEELTAYIELPENYDVNDVDSSSIYIVSSWYGISVELYPTEVGDYDKDGIPDLMVKFSKDLFLLVLGVLSLGTVWTYYYDGWRRLEVFPPPHPIDILYRYDVGMYNFLYRYDETGEITLTIIGQLSNGKFFIGNDTIKITNLN